MLTPINRSAGRAPRVAGGFLHQRVAVNTLATGLD